MKHFKIKVDRKRMTREEIESRQNFDSILKQVKATKTPLWKNALFYGSIGLAGIAVIIGYSSITKKELNDNNITLKQNAIIAINEVSDSEQPVLLASASVSVNTAEAYIPAKKKATANTDLSKQLDGNSVAEENKAKQLLEDVKQKTTVVEKNKPSSINAMPTLDGVYNGDISFDRFTVGEVTVAKELQVKEFSIQYTSRNGDKTISVAGSHVPEDVLAEMKKIGLNQTVFITNVVAVGGNGELYRCYSMDLNVKFN